MPLPSKGHDRGYDGGGAADPGRQGAREEEVWSEGREGQVHVEEAMINKGCWITLDLDYTGPDE